MATNTNEVRAEHCAELETLLLEAGASSVTLMDAEDQPVFQREPGAQTLWGTSTLTGLFPLEQNLGPTRNLTVSPSGTESRFAAN